MAEQEGFICPLCKADCLSVRELETHYREEHDESSTTRLKNNFRSFIDRAKNTLRIDKSPRLERAEFVRSGTGEEAGAVESDPVARGDHVTNVSGINVDYWDPQEIGRVVDHGVEFRRTRDAYLANIVVETNRLVIRLEKLFRLLKENTPRTAKQMKSVEQNIVPWRRDGEDKCCRNCGRDFNVRRRRHHCRLCGGIMCKQCSRFMTLAETYPLLRDCPDYPSLAISPSLRRRRLLKPKRAHPSTEGEEEEGEGPTDDIRMCNTCKHLVNRRLIHLEGLEKPIVVALYEKMHFTMTESERLKPGVVEVAGTLWSGDPGPRLEDATIQRQELLRVYESIDSISKDMMNMTGSEASPREQKLARNVRVFASNYLQEHLLTLPSLPTKKQIQEVKEEKEREAQEKLRQLEQQREEQRRNRQLREAELASESGIDKLSAGIDKFSTGVDKMFKDFSKDVQTKMAVNFKRGDESMTFSGEGESDGGVGGWMCNTDKVTRSVDCEEDPFSVQREQLLSYIAQARDARRMDEVRALEQSLRDIEIAMKEQDMSYGFDKK